MVWTPHEHIHRKTPVRPRLKGRTPRNTQVMPSDTQNPRQIGQPIM